MAKFKPEEHSVAEVAQHLEQADPDEKQRVLAEERAGQARKTVLEQHERTDSTGRELNPWEVSPADQVSVAPSEES